MISYYYWCHHNKRTCNRYLMYLFCIYHLANNISHHQILIFHSFQFCLRKFIFIYRSSPVLTLKYKYKAPMTKLKIEHKISMACFSDISPKNVWDVFSLQKYMLQFPLIFQNLSRALFSNNLKLLLKLKKKNI